MGPFMGPQKEQKLRTRMRQPLVVNMLAKGSKVGLLKQAKSEDKNLWTA